jgi:MYXO-CTERM domain-containing protein
MPLMAAPNLFDDFENGVGGDIVWAPHGNTSGNPTTPNGNNNLVTTATNEHSVSGIRSARAFASDPATWNGFTDFGATTGFVRASVWVFEDYNYGTHSDPGETQPVTTMLSLWGDSGTNALSTGTDYLQLGVVSFLPGGNQQYSVRSRVNGADPSANTFVTRKAGWTHLAIEADALASGGQVRFYIDGNQVGTSTRSAGIALRWVRIGNNSKSYENFWYDDVSVTPEPAGLALLALGSVVLRRGRRQPV